MLNWLKISPRLVINKSEISVIGEIKSMVEEKMKQIILSVIMPVYNGEQYLDYSIQSVLNQTYKDYELILVDDGSTDHSLEICEKY